METPEWKKFLEEQDSVFLAMVHHQKKTIARKIVGTSR
jgi:hypothetical protein